MAQERAAVRFTAIVSKCEWVPASVERRRVATVVTSDRVTLRWLARALGALLLFGASPGPVSAQTPPRTHAPDADDDDEEDSAAADDDDADDDEEHAPAIPEAEPPPQPDIDEAQQRAATREYERLMARSRGRRDAASRRAFTDQLHSFVLRFPGAAEAPIAIGHEAELLSQTLSSTTAEPLAEAAIRRIDALADLPGAPLSEVRDALSEAFAAGYVRRPLPVTLAEVVLGRHPSLDGLALDLREQRQRAHDEAERARDPEAMREWARARAERTRCIDECLQEEDTCSGYRQRVLVGRGGVVLVSRVRVRGPCAMRLEDCQMGCGMDERDPEWAGED